ncbi:MAG TPA: Spy/CpxP family protein refolding chaperone [Pyrinomonadaceae bacterium]|jgi:Spy/CpxP family protein refolding chaperone|nr:Spy/CpxP family protein refolding chaperone [Pyrinomonadaceae bacterium]
MKESIHKKAVVLGGAMLSALFLFSSHMPATQAQTVPGEASQQDEPAAEEEVSRSGGGDGEMLTRLNLSPEQRAQIVGIRRRSEGEGRVLVQRLRRARRALDASIYAENVDDKLIEEGVREVAAAQAEVVRLRAVTELRLRRVLTPEQLGLLRDWRQRARLRQRMQGRPRNRQGNSDTPQNAVPPDAFNSRLGRRRQAPPAQSDSPTPPPPRARRGAINPLRRQ